MTEIEKEGKKLNAEIEKIVDRIDGFDKQLREMGNEEQKIIDEVTKVDREKDTFEARMTKCIAAKGNAEEKVGVIFVYFTLIVMHLR